MSEEYDYYDGWHRKLQRDCCPECHKVYGSPDGIRGRSDLYNGVVYDHQGNATRRITTPHIRPTGRSFAWRAGSKSTSTRRRETRRVTAGSVPSTTFEVVV